MTKFKCNLSQNKDGLAGISDDHDHYKYGPNFTFL
jgi:hypothetical protein